MTLNSLLAVNDFSPIPALISYALNDVMRCDPTEHPVLVTEPPWNTQENRERMAEIMFEEFHAPAFYIANTGVLNAYVHNYHLSVWCTYLLKHISASPPERAQLLSSTSGTPLPASLQSWTVLSSEKVPNICVVILVKCHFPDFAELPGMVQSSLPALVSAHAKHLLSSPFHNRPGIQLLPHQLIANKQVRLVAFPRIL